MLKLEQLEDRLAPINLLISAVAPVFDIGAKVTFEVDLSDDSYKSCIAVSYIQIEEEQEVSLKDYVFHSEYSGPSPDDLEVVIDVLATKLQVDQNIEGHLESTVVVENEQISGESTVLDGGTFNMEVTDLPPSPEELCPV